MGCVKVSYNMMGIEKTQRMNELLDVYSELLTKKQKEVLMLYYEEDFSLAEIAESLSISRAAVSDHLKRSEKLLKEYEEKLKIVQRNVSRAQIYDKIKSFGNQTVNVLIESLEALDE